MSNIVDLSTYTYQDLIPKIQKLGAAKSEKISSFIDEKSLDQVLSNGADLSFISNEVPGSLPLIETLYHCKIFLMICEVEKPSLSQGEKAINSLEYLKQKVPSLDTSSCIDDFVSNLDLTISECDLLELRNWAELIKRIPSHLGSYESFVPLLGIRVKCLI